MWPPIAALVHARRRWLIRLTRRRGPVRATDRVYMTTSPDGDTVSFERRVAEIQERYGPDDLVTFFIRQAKPELQAAVERTEASLRIAGIEFT